MVERISGQVNNGSGATNEQAALSVSQGGTVIECNYSSESGGVIDDRAGGDLDIVAEDNPAIVAYIQAGCGVVGSIPSALDQQIVIGIGDVVRVVAAGWVIGIFGEGDLQAGELCIVDA